MVKKIGVLSLQGDFQKHIDMIKALNVNAMQIKYPGELDDCSALIIPGGESTAISLLIKNNGFINKIKKFSINNPIMGTCAGMVMLSSNKNENNMTPLEIMDFQVKRNGWGRQINSFKSKIKLEFDQKNNFEAVFIRAPRVYSINNQMKVLASINGEPVMLTDGKHFACSFHPELGNDKRVYKHFIDKINE